MWNTIPYNTSTILRESEEIIFLRIRENRTEITEHIGRSNSQINVHFTIQDSPSFLSTLTIHGRDYVQVEDSMNCFSDGTRHGQNFVAKDGVAQPPSGYLIEKSFQLDGREYTVPVPDARVVIATRIANFNARNKAIKI